MPKEKKRATEFKSHLISFFNVFFWKIINFLSKKHEHISSAKNFIMLDKALKGMLQKYFKVMML